MDQIKIGSFIADRRRALGLTQMQLAERLGITDRAVSKWETGRAMPDTSVMLMLCDILKITVNDLLHGEVIQMENYDKKSEEMLIELTRQKQEADRQLLTLEILIGLFSTFILLGLVMLGALLQIDTWLRVVLIIAGFALGVTGFFFALRIEQKAGYYECAHCHHKYVPEYKAMVNAMHMGRTRYMKCPECGQKSWQKKIVNKD